MTQQTSDGAISLPPSYKAERIAADLGYPTHIAIGTDGQYYLTRLNGPENAGQGQVIRIGVDGKAEVLLDGLQKPVGLVWAEGALYLTLQNSVRVSRPGEDGKFSAPIALFDNIPFNGRSIGQIAYGPDGRLYFQSTGTELAPNDSGQIFSFRPDASDRRIVARGFKNAYAFAWNPQNGLMYATEIYDGVVPGGTAAPEELNIIREGGNYGWPLCYANQKENTLVGGNRNYCADTDGPLALFPPHATPTGLAFFDGKLIVALWGTEKPRLVAVDPAKGTVNDFAIGFKRPVALLAEPKTGALLVVDIEGSALYRITKTGSQNPKGS